MVLFRRDQQEDHRSLSPLALRTTLMGARGSSRDGDEDAFTVHLGDADRLGTDVPLLIIELSARV